MGFAIYCKVFTVLCIAVSLATELSVLEDELLMPDLNFLSDARNLFQPELTDINMVSHPGRVRVGEADYQDVDMARTFASTGHGGSSAIRNHGRHKAREEISENDQEIAMTPVDVRAITWKPESVTLVDRCQRGILRGGSDLMWNETACITCECRSLDVECKRPKCPKLDCENKIQPEGECCPKCPEKLCQTDDGRRFQDGAEWHKDDCTYCKCRKGKVLCSVEDCQIPACGDPVKVPGRCCPVCMDTSCHAANGTHITSGEVWKEGVCTHCYCAGGEKKTAQEKCPYINCTARYTPQGKCCPVCDSGVVNCDVSNWGSWADCPVQECGGGMTRRFRSVVVPHRNGGAFCPHMSEAKMCPRLPCDVLPVCPVTEWSSWGHCTATCGSGRKMRSRARAPITKATMTSLIDCSTTHLQETVHCYVGACMSALAMFDSADSLIHDDICYQVTWSDWGPCSVGCGSGIQKRRQELINSSHPRGHLCHLLEEYKTCQGQSCVNREKTAMRCRVSPWADWSPCSKTCGPGGRKTKHRTVLQQPSGGARPCPKLFISKPCRAKPCQAKNHFLEGLCLSQDGHVYRNGERWKGEQCAACTCNNSRIQCRKGACSR